MPNADTGGLEIMEKINSFVKNNENAYVFESLGQLIYLSCMAIVDGVVGNSSSGILESPTLKVGTINIGDRQLGRTQSVSVINARASKESIEEALDELFTPEFRSTLDTFKSPYGEGGASRKIVRVLSNFDFDINLQKAFYDL
jgi:GDP/UDP-N,N'-diacetylbacillosamine 2-epimerase (hydrolysing)